MNRCATAVLTLFGFALLGCSDKIVAPPKMTWPSNFKLEAASAGGPPPKKADAEAKDKDPEQKKDNEKPSKESEQKKDNDKTKQAPPKTNID